MIRVPAAGQSGVHGVPANVRHSETGRRWPVPRPANVRQSGQPCSPAGSLDGVFPPPMHPIAGLRSGAGIS
jgi:hypothetical protein